MNTKKTWFTIVVIVTIVIIVSMPSAARRACRLRNHPTMPL